MVSEGRGTIVNSGAIRVHLSGKEFRKYILKRDNYTCQYCGKPGNTVDHIIPRSKGGYSTPKNCVCACSACNLKKGDKILGADVG